MDENVSKVVYALIGAALSQVLSELTRVWRKTRLVMRTSGLPSIAITLHEGAAAIRIVGEYRIINLSELPIKLQRPHLLGYNIASRGFQVKLVPSARSDLREVLCELTVAPNEETVLLSDASAVAIVERFLVRRVPRFLWLETLELVRIGHQHRFRHRAALYRRTYAITGSEQYWFNPAGYEVGSQLARLAALPGKIVLRIRASWAQSRDGSAG